MNSSRNLDWEKAYAEFLEKNFLGTLKKLVFDILKSWCIEGEMIDILTVVQNDKWYRLEINKKAWLNDTCS